MPRRQDSKSLTRQRKAAAAKQKASSRASVDEVATTAGPIESLESPVEVDIPVVGRPD